MRNDILNNKRILMFAPNFFGYRESIAQELRQLGCNVDLYDERPNNGVFCKIMLRYHVRFYDGVVREYYRSVIAENAGKEYDYVFVIKSEAINEKIFAELRQAYPKARFILYLWDSVENVPDGKQKIRMYDRVLTFDPVDAKMYGLEFRPLFYLKTYEAAPEESAEYTYDVAFIGTAHSARPRIVKQIEKQCTQWNGKCFHYLFLPHPLVFLYNKLLNWDYRGVRKQDIRFTPIPAEEIRAVYHKSKSILDVEHGAQRGLTMRTIEMIGMNKKLITTNKQICDYDFYDPNNICVIDRDDPVVTAGFLNSAFTPVQKEILQRYSLRAFVQEIFEEKENKHEH